MCLLNLSIIDLMVNHMDLLLNFPLYLSRYHNLVIDYPIDVTETQLITGIFDTNLEEAMTETFDWFIEFNRINK